MRLFRSAPIPEEVELTLPSRMVSVRVRTSPRARAYRLSINARGEPVLTVPQSGRWSDARAFLDRHVGWLDTRLAGRPVPTPVGAGSLLPLRGIPHRIVSAGVLRGTVVKRDGPEGPELAIPGDAEHLGRRLVDFLRHAARKDLEDACMRHAGTLGVAIAALRLRDQTTRWGSCSAARILNFNWRLILAPPHVLDYVAAHEVAHILEMNHAPAFWRTVERTLPDYEEGRSWLKANGHALMSLQFGAG